VLVVDKIVCNATTEADKAIQDGLTCVCIISICVYIFVINL